MPDSAAGHPVLRLAPKSWHPLLQLARLDRPIGWWLLLLPWWWSSALASIYQGGPLRVRDLLLFFAGAVVMRGAGSTYNDIIDRDIDAKVERTKWRPLASGRIGATAAAVFLAAQCLAGLAVLLSFNGFTIFLGFASLGVVGIYPFMKRISSWPQAVLGAAFAWGALIGWAAALGSLAPAPLWLYLGAVFWTIGYDTIYAVQDIEDDALAGIGSTARAFGEHLRLGIGALYALAVMCIEAALLSAGAGSPAQGGLLLFASHLAWQVMRVDPSNGALALRLFRSNRDAGLMLFAGLAAEIIFAPK
ncbi:MAG: 4-hydroxybenzoate octaprenyltransferase [Pseudomonadota bacterium]|nr:4-hydroxybenzoate octaprenyltransferase [Pseudomonadota bacterium]